MQTKHLFVLLWVHLPFQLFYIVGFDEEEVKTKQKHIGRKNEDQLVIMSSVRKIILAFALAFIIDETEEHKDISHISLSLFFFKHVQETFP